MAITFDEALNKIVASRVLVGHLYWRTLDFSPALKELEPTCPTLWDYDTAKESLDNEVRQLLRAVDINSDDRSN